MTNRFRILCAAVSAALAAVASPAWACGGFFCFTQPIDQSAERILYVQKESKVTVHIQISYTGDDKAFSWLLPLQKVPQNKGLQPSSDSIFQLLEQYTSPTFQLQWKNTAECNVPMCVFDARSTAGGPPNADDGGKGVKVLMEENVGPYQAVVIGGEPGKPPVSGKDIVDWLNANKYQQPPASAGLLDQYAKENFVFLALKLQKDKGVGDLTPIAVTIDEVGPCLPIRLTAIATQPDMPIAAWVIGKARAIPKNYLHVEINDAVIDWLGGGSNYKAVVSKAVDLGSGHAFLTELAKPTKSLPIPFAQTEWSAAKLQGLTDPADMLSTLFQMGLPRTTQLQGIIKKFIKKDEKYKDVTDQQFYGCIQNYKQMGGGADAKCKEWYDSAVALGFDGKAMAAEVDSNVIAPLKALDADYKALPYLTRLYTTLSAEEMNKDPVFGFNADLPEVSNQHTAEATPMCDAGSKTATKAKLKFSDGKEITYDIPKELQAGCPPWVGTVGFGKGGDKAPIAAGGQALKKVQVLDESGAALDIDQSDADLVDAKLSFAKLGQPSLSTADKEKLKKVTWDPYAQGNPGTKPSGADAVGADAGKASTPAAAPASDGGCAGAPLASQAWWALAAAVAMIARRRRSA